MYHAQLHDAHPGQFGNAALISDKPFAFGLDAELLRDRIVVRTWRKLRFEVTRTPKRQDDFHVSVWDGPTFLLAAKLDLPKAHVNAGDFLETDLTWTMMHKETT